MKKQELNEKELAQVVGGALGYAGDRTLGDAGTVVVKLPEDDLQVSWKNLGQIQF